MPALVLVVEVAVWQAEHRWFGTTAFHRAGGNMGLSKRKLLAVSVPMVFGAAIYTGAWANPAKGADVTVRVTDRQEGRADEGSVRECKHDSDQGQENGRRWGRGHANDGDKDRGDSDRSDHDRGHRGRADHERGDHDRGNNDRDNRGRGDRDRDDDNDRAGSPPGSSHPSTTPSSIPEPGTLALFGLGILGTALAQRRRRSTLG